MFIRLFSIYMYRNDVCSNLIIGHNLSIGHNTLSDKNSSDKIVEISSWCRKFCPTKNFVRRKFCPMFQYKSQAKIGQKCRNFGLVSKILSDEKFCPSKILSNISIQKSGKNRTKLSKFRLGVENFVRRNILSVENFVRRNFVR